MFDGFFANDEDCINICEGAGGLCPSRKNIEVVFRDLFVRFFYFYRTIAAVDFL